MCCSMNCMTALTDVVENLRADLDNNMICILVLLNRSKAFDTVDHSILLKKLENRSQIVSYNGTCSESLDVDRGVPQGSVLLFPYYSAYILMIYRIL